MGLGRVGFPAPSGSRVAATGSPACHPPWRRRSRTMTADAVRSYPSLPDHQPHRTGAGAITVRLIRESYAQVQPRAPEVMQLFYAMLFAIAPTTRELFAANMEVQRSRFWRGLMHIVQHFDRPDELVPFLHQLGRDHRKFGVLDAHYDAMGTALVTSLKQYAGAAWT